MHVPRRGSCRERPIAATAFSASTRRYSQAPAPLVSADEHKSDIDPPLRKATQKERKTSSKKKKADLLIVEDSKEKKRTTTKSSGPKHWTVDSDEIVFQHLSISQTAIHGNATIDAVNEATTVPSLLRFTVRGNPLPLRRHRTSRGFVYNPSAGAQQSFRETVEELVFPHRRHCKVSDTPSEYSSSEPRTPLWGPEQTLAVTIVFRMKRPNIHFVAGKPGPDRLRDTAPMQVSSTLRTDVDNLAKFVLDSLIGVVYNDDRQIASLHVTKLYDNDVDELCRGSTCVCIRLLREDDLPRLLSTSLDMF
jgi:Endodeoxyribonuclease RusA